MNGVQNTDDVCYQTPLSECSKTEYFVYVLKYRYTSTWIVLCSLTFWPERRYADETMWTEDGQSNTYIRWYRSLRTLLLWSIDH